MKIAFHLCQESTPYIESLKSSLGYDCILEENGKVGKEYTHILRVEESGISLLANVETSGASAAPTKVDFLEASLTHRRLSSGKSQGIAKAIGLNKHEHPAVLDATAGLGKDSFILASLGCSITLLERSPIVHALLKDGIKRGLTEGDGDVYRALQAMTLINTDALTWMAKILAGELEKPDVIYLDPMFPPRSKSAKVKKDMSLLQQVLGIDEDFDELLKAARACAKHRVVVKRPGKRTKKVEPKPSFQIEGKSTHFDVFV